MRGKLVSERWIIRMLYIADSVVAMSVMVRAHELICELIMVSIIVSFE